MLLVAVLLLLELRVPSEGPDGFDDDEYLLGRMQSIIGPEIAAAAPRTGRWTTIGGANAMRRRVNMMLYRRTPRGERMGPGGGEAHGVLRRDGDGAKLEVDSALAGCQDKGTDETAENLFK